MSKMRISWCNQMGCAVWLSKIQMQGLRQLFHTNPSGCQCLKPFFMVLEVDIRETTHRGSRQRKRLQFQTTLALVRRLSCRGSWVEDTAKNEITVISEVEGHCERGKADRYSVRTHETLALPCGGSLGCSLADRICPYRKGLLPPVYANRNFSYPCLASKHHLLCNALIISTSENPVAIAGNYRFWNTPT
jgi:hypothetical protein